jgi:hypothetical protein
LHLRCLRDDINIFTLDCDHGLGVITWGKQENKLNYTIEQIKQFTFEDFDQNRQSWINLKPADYFFDYFHLKK